MTKAQEISEKPVSDLMNERVEKETKGEGGSK